MISRYPLLTYPFRSHLLDDDPLKYAIFSPLPSFLDLISPRILIKPTLGLNMINRYLPTYPFAHTYLMMPIKTAL